MTLAAPADVALSTQVERLAEELSERWQQGECCQVERLLSANPELADCAEAVIALIDEEVFLRRQRGMCADLPEYVRRFPRWRAQLEILFNCHEILDCGERPSAYPEVGESWAEFRLLAELGQGAQGRVYLATQSALADRPVVLKLTPRRGREHLSLARLQHTHIVPLFSVVDDAAHDLRGLCMPYFGGASLADLLAALPDGPSDALGGLDLLDALDRLQRTAPVAKSAPGAARQFLARINYVQAVCWIGACLADALKYAHERGLVHLDLKPSNVLLAADGQPMLLDFHLAHEPIAPRGPLPGYLGGSPHYMSPEQREAVAALREGRAIPKTVDGRSDIYSLGLILAEALGGRWQSEAPVAAAPSLDRKWISAGLADLIGKCLEPEAGDRYADAGALAGDLWRHLNDLPLQGVANRSFVERWQKWRRRRPYALALSSLAAAFLLAAALVTSFAFDFVNQQAHQARGALREAQEYLAQHAPAEAIRTAERGLILASRIPRHQQLKDELTDCLQRARQARAVRELHEVADRFRFLYGADCQPAAQTQILNTCRTVWDQRHAIQGALAGHNEPELERIRADLLDIAILMADLNVQLAPAGQASAAQRDAVRLLDEARGLFGPSPVLSHERHRFTATLGLREPADRTGDIQPRSAWEHYAIGRAYLQTGNLKQAAAYFDRAVALEPHGLWPNFYWGTCAYRQRHYDEAVVAFTACVVLAPESAGCFYNRATAYMGLGRADRALQDLDHALRLDPALAPAALNRGILHYQAARYLQAEADLRLAEANGADRAVVQYNLAHVRLGQKDVAGALSCLERSLAVAPQYLEARTMYDRLRNRRSADVD
jgi:serine/threonine protein kinase